MQKLEKKPKEADRTDPRLEQVSGGVPAKVKAKMEEEANLKYDGNIAFVLRQACKDWYFQKTGERA